MDRSRRLDEALEAMLRGAPVEDGDPEIRELVRLAARLAESRDALAPVRREALRLRIMRRLDLGPRPSFPERLALAVRLLAIPAPVLARATVAVVLVVSLAAGVTAASADSLPDDQLYGWKLATEQARLALALDPEDRAAVELSIALHRLGEAAALAEQGREVEADAATSAFGEHVANAAALLQDVPPRSSAGLADKVRSQFEQQQRAVAAQADRIARSGKGEPAFAAALRQVTASVGAGSSLAPDRIAAAAAQAAQRAATSAGQRAAQQPSTAQVRASPSPARSSARPLTPEQLRAQRAAQAAQLAAQRAKEAADKANQKKR